jgi:hypothetical protein
VSTSPERVEKRSTNRPGIALWRRRARRNSEPSRDDERRHHRRSGNSRLGTARERWREFGALVTVMVSVALADMR